MLPIKEDDEFFSRIVTKESSMANPSFRVYYGGNAVAVPFVWEVKPGTPKHTNHSFSNEEQNKDHLPPLTPPPSYYLNHPNKLPCSGSKKFSTNKIFQGLFHKSMHRRQLSSTSSSSSSALSCPSSSMLISDSAMRSSSNRSRSRSWSWSQSQSQSQSQSRASKRSTLSKSTGSLFDLMVNGHQEDDEQEADMRSPRSVLCFGFVGSRRTRACSVV